MAYSPMLGPMFMSRNYDYEVQRTNNFEVLLSDLFGMESELTLAVESCPFPVITNEPIELAYGNSRVKVAGQATFDDVELQVKDFITADLENVIWRWRCQVYNPDSNEIGWARDYKKNGHIVQFAPDGTCPRAWKIEGVWPTTFNSGDLSYDGSDKKLISMTLSVDKAYLDSALSPEEERPTQSTRDNSSKTFRGDRWYGKTLSEAGYSQF